jgi:hypothetical protein
MESATHMVRIHEKLPGVYFMGNVSPQTVEGSAAGKNAAGENELQGRESNGSAQKKLAVGAEDDSERDTDVELHLEGEAETNANTLYRDGLDLDEDYDTPAGTRGSSGTIP